MELLAGLDVGTSSVKAVLMTMSGREVGASRVPLNWSHTRYGVEIDATTLTRCSIAALQIAQNGLQDLQVLALGVCSAAESGILVDGADIPLGSFIAWHDHRDEAELAMLASDLGADEFSARTGLPFRSQWSLTKHRWLQTHLPSFKQAMRRFNIAEWVVHSMGGESVTELSLASRTGWLDLETGRPWSEALDWAGASRVGLGELVTAGTPLGKVSKSHILSAFRGATLTVAGHDHQAAAVGCGAINAGDELDSCGTAEALVRAVPANLSSASIKALTHQGITVGWHVISGLWCVLGGLKSGLMMEHVLQYLKVDPTDFAELDSEALCASPESSWVEWRGPDSFEVTGSDLRGDVWRAATRSVTREVRELRNKISHEIGLSERLIVAGGWSESSTLMLAKNEILGSYIRSRILEAGARGSAILAGLALGCYRSLSDAPVAEIERREGQL